MTGQDLAQVFRPVIQEIIALVQTQMDFCVLKPDAILLVGGFGANPFLRQSLKAAFPHTEVMQPANGWTAVVRGALTKAMAEATPDVCKINISSRIARRYYGLPLSEEFKADKHASPMKYWSPCEGRNQIDVMKWLVRKGDVLEESKPTVIYCYLTRLCTEGPFQSSISYIYVFDDGVPPMYKDHNVKHLAILNADLSSIPSHRYKTVTGADEQQYYEIHFQIRATFFSAHTEYSLWFAGESFGSVQAEYA